MKRILLVAAALLAAARAGAQAPTPAMPGPTPGADDPSTTTEDPAVRRPGRFRVGPMYFTPSLRIGSIGLDTNVFYTPIERRSDISGSGGPRLELVVPVRSRVRLWADGGFTYIYFVRTASQRKWVRDLSAGFDAKGTRTELALGGAYIETFGRPSYEIDRRVEQTTQRANAGLRRRLAGRTSFTLGGTFTRSETADGQPFLGADLRRTLTSDSTRGDAGLEYDMTIKTALVFEGSVEQVRFRFDPARDGRRLLAVGGLRTDASALISGHAVAGVRQHRFDDPVYADQRGLYASVDATWNLSMRTRLGVVYTRDIEYTAFVTVLGSPVVQRETMRAALEKELGPHFDLRLAVGRTQSKARGTVRLEAAPGRFVDVQRNDRYDEAGADFGYRFGQRFRIGATARYTERGTNFADFGVDGLLVGGTLTFTP